MKVLDVHRFPAGGPPIPAAATGRWRRLRGHLRGRTDLRAGRTRSGSQIACATERVPAVLDTRPGALRRLLRISESVKAVDFHEPTETAYMADDSVKGGTYRWGYRRDEVHAIGSVGGLIEDLKVSPDGNRLACALKGEGVVTVSLSSGEVEARLGQEQSMGQQLRMVFFQDSTRLVTFVQYFSFITQFDREDPMTRICSWHLATSRLCFRQEREGWDVKPRGFVADGATILEAESWAGSDAGGDAPSLGSSSGSGGLVRPALRAPPSGNRGRGRDETLRPPQAPRVGKVFAESLRLGPLGAFRGGRAEADPVPLREGVSIDLEAGANFRDPVAPFEGVHHGVRPGRFLGSVGAASEESTQEIL